MKKVASVTGDCLVSIYYTPHRSVQRIYEEWDIAINVNQLGISIII